MKSYQAIVGLSPGSIEARNKFLETFENTGSGKGKDGLKWVTSAVKEISHNDHTAVARLENYFTRLEICVYALH